MSLDLSKLKNLRVKSNGWEAQCPACAETGNDRQGQHLRIDADGKFGCCVFAGNSDHRKRIFALVGQRGRNQITVRVAVASGQPVQRGILKRVALDQGTKPDAPDGGNEMQNGDCRMQNEKNKGRTGRTGEQQSEAAFEMENQQRTGRTGQPDCTGELFTSERTLRTPQLSLRVAEENRAEEKYVYPHKGFDEGVRCVRQQRMPYLTASGDLGIPFDSPERYHWWKGGQSPRQTKQELLAEGQHERK